MKVVILAGGYGTRLAEETDVKPKPMVEIGGKPILWHIMKIYSYYGFNNFIICLGYKGYYIKEFFRNYMMNTADVTLSLSENTIKVHRKRAEPWNITLVDTGGKTMTGGRIKAIKDYLDDELFFMTYGDGVGDIDIPRLLSYHLSHKRKATVTAVTPPGRFGVLDINNKKVIGFREKIASDQYLINAGFFVLSKKVLSYIEDSNTVWESTPMLNLALKGELMAYEHKGFWHPIDTLRDLEHLNKLWGSGNSPWKIW